MSNEKIVEGVFAINKPQGISSAQVVRDLQSHFNPSSLFAPWIKAERSKRVQESQSQRKRRRDKRPAQVKIGHGGTLDPLATGVLIAGVGKGTKQLQTFLSCTKTYETVVLFGVATDSYDRVGKVLSHAPYAHITRTLVEEKLAQFRGKIMQRPPIFSALRVQGKKLYEYAREGKEVPVEIQERPVEVLSLELLDWMDGGTHSHKWPTEEAPPEEREVANKVLHVKTEDSPTPAPIQTEPRSEEEARGIKREREDDNDTPDSNTLPPTKQQRRTSNDAEPLMSGGLPPSTATTTTQPPETNNPTPEPPQPPAARLRLTSTSGFYVRSLCHDLGASLDSLGIMAELVRTRQAEYELAKNVLEYEDLEAGEEVWGPKVTRLIEDEAVGSPTGEVRSGGSGSEGGS